MPSMIYTIPLVSLTADAAGDFVPVPVRTVEVEATGVLDAMAFALDTITPEEESRVFASMPTGSLS